MLQSKNRYDDLAGCRSALAEAFQAVSQPGNTTQYEWCSLAVALGRCRLFGVDLSDKLDGTLTVPQAQTAAAEVARELARCSTRAMELGPRWDRTSEPDEAMRLVTSLLQDRMDAWAALVALDEAFEAGLSDGAADINALSDDLNSVMDALDAFDVALEHQLNLLSVVAGTALLNNWRVWLTPEFSAERPWWLDGRLEAAARKLEAVVAAVTPSPEQLTRLRQKLPPTRTPVALGTILPPFRQPVQRAAAQVDPTSLPAPAITLRWESPDGLWFAELHLPAWSDEEQERLSRPVNFRARADDALAKTLNQPIRLGGATGRIEQGRFRVTLAQLRQIDEPGLEVGEPAVVWPLVSSSSDANT